MLLYLFYDPVFCHSSKFSVDWMPFKTEVKLTKILVCKLLGGSRISNKMHTGIPTCPYVW